MGLSLEEAARRIRMEPLSLRFLEEGVGDPTLAQVERMSKAYQRPVIAFYLPEPPDDEDRLPDFRLLPENYARTWSPEMHLAFRRVRTQRESIISITETTGDQPADLAVALSLDDDPEEAGEEIRLWLAAPIPESLAALTPGRVLQAWSSAVERQPILVTQVDDVSVDEMRGFSLSERPFPTIAVNSNDSLRGRLFTLGHELAHVLLRNGGLCDLEERRQKPVNHKERLERFCNEVSAGMLMPRQAVLQHPLVRHEKSHKEWSDDELFELAGSFGVSAEAMLLRLVSLGRASRDSYFRRRAHFLAIYEARRRREEQRRRDRPQGSGGMPGNERRIRNYGRRFVRTVVDAYRQEQINGADLAYYLDMKLTNLPGLLEEMEKA
jgi:Zn-dependent peptidase ImmA (M78 family)